MAHEILRYMKTNKNQVYNMSLKLDIGRAYDRVKWNFWEKLL